MNEPVYTPPPAQPAPVPLTDEQINDIWSAKDNPQHRTTLSPWGLDRIRAIIKAALSTQPAQPAPEPEEDLYDLAVKADNGGQP